MSIHLTQQQANTVLRSLVFYAIRRRNGEFMKILSNLILLRNAGEKHEEYITAKLMSELGLNLTLDPIVKRVEPEVEPIKNDKD